MCAGDDARRRVVQPQPKRSANEQLPPITSKLYAAVSNIEMYCKLLSQADSCTKRRSSRVVTVRGSCLEWRLRHEEVDCIIARFICADAATL